MHLLFIRLQVFPTSYLTVVNKLAIANTYHALPTDINCTDKNMRVDKRHPWHYTLLTFRDVLRELHRLIKRALYLSQLSTG